jgi:hypothetical protein
MERGRYLPIKPHIDVAICYSTKGGCNSRRAAISWEASTVFKVIILDTRYIGAAVAFGVTTWANRPSDLAVRISNRSGPDDGVSRETFTLPIEAARLKARKIINQFPQRGYMTIVEHGFS